MKKKKMIRPPVRIDRVVITTEDGQIAEAVNFKRACQYGVFPDLVFVRNDGWSLGCVLADEQATFDLWAGDWKYKVNLKTGERIVLSGEDGFHVRGA